MADAEARERAEHDAEMRRAEYWHSMPTFPAPVHATKSACYSSELRLAELRKGATECIRMLGPDSAVSKILLAAMEK